MKLPRQLSIMVLGMLVTSLAAACWYGGMTRQLDLWFLDWKLRKAPAGEVSDDLVHVDIDDSSIEELGRWPWPRKQLAGIVDTLKSCGAEAIALDIEFPEPQTIRYVSEANSIYGGYKKVLHASVPQAVMDDAELARSITDARNVVLSMHMDFDNDQLLPFEKQITEVLTEDPYIPFRQLCLKVAQIDTHASASSKIEDQLHKAYLRVAGRMALKKFSLGDLSSPEQTIAPLVTLTPGAKNVGFVTVDPDEDGIVRRIRLLANDADNTYGQLGFVLALDKLQMQYDKPLKLKTKRNFLFVFAGDELVRAINLKDGNILINWSLGSRDKNKDTHRHIGAKAVVKVWQEKQRLSRLGELEFGLKVKWISLLRKLDDPQLDELFWGFNDNTEKLDKLYLQRVMLQKQQYFNSLYDKSQPSLSEQMGRLLAEEKQLEQIRFQQADKLYRKCLTDREKYFDRPCKILPLDASDELVAKYEDYLSRIRQAYELQKILQEIPGDRAELTENISKLQQELKGIVSGKICLIGSTATAAADFVPTAIDKLTPGVMVHARIYDSIISDKFINQTPKWFNVMVIIVAGLVMTLLALRYNASICGPVCVILGILFASYNAYVVIPDFGVNITIAGPVLAMLAVFIVHTGYKEITEERAKRKIRGMFSKALSSSLVDELMRDPTLANLGGQKRELSCMFSDLAGFTPLSQHLGAHETVSLLNRYFDCVTDVVQTKRGGYINKFLGDGIFALFGAPVTQGNHAERAIRSAVEYIQAVRQLNVEIPHDDLLVRIGITTGTAMVGNCGSTNRMDYTAIGDCVNLSSRLESANKFYRTNILIEKLTWRQAGIEDEVLARPLGLARITGVSQPVWVVNVVGTIEDNQQLVEPYEIFTRGMKLLYEKDYTRAVEVFEQVSKDLDQDHCVSLFLQIAREGQAGELYQSTVSPPAQYSGGVVRIIPPWEVE